MLPHRGFLSWRDTNRHTADMAQSLTMSFTVSVFSPNNGYTPVCSGALKRTSCPSLTATLIKNTASRSFKKQ